MDSLIELKEHEDLSLADEADRNWTEVLDQTYIFNRKRREVNKTCIVFVNFTQDFPNLKLMLGTFRLCYEYEIEHKYTIFKFHRMRWECDAIL